MAFSFSSPRTWRYDVFTSYYGQDVQRTFLSHLHKELSNTGITMFNDQGVERSRIIAPSLNNAIKESRISIVVLSKNYASSSWCLDELVEILKCRDDNGQLVMPVFYGVDPSDVLKQTGDFGTAFNKICAHITEEEIRIWSQALEDVGNIDGEDFRNWDDESKMIEKIARNVSLIVLDQLNAAVSKSPDIEQGLVANEPSSSNTRKSKCRCCTGLAFFVAISLLLEIVSAIADQLSSIRKPYFARISLAMSVLSVILSILDLTHKIRANKARFRCKWPIPWFYYPSHGYRRIFGSFNDTVLLFCVVGGLVVSTINFSFIEKGKDGPIKVSLWPLFFAIGMVASTIMEKPVISNDHSL